MWVYNVHTELIAEGFSMQSQLLTEDQLADVLSRLPLDRLQLWFEMLLAFEERHRRLAERGAVAAA